jgi:hypothetical protein
MAAMAATATVCTGWKTAVNSGPPLSMHQICRAKATPDATSPYKYLYFLVSVSELLVWNKGLLCEHVVLLVSQINKLLVLTAYRIVNSSPPELTFHLLRSSSVKIAMATNWISPKMHVKDRTESLAGYLFSTGTWCKKFTIFNSSNTSIPTHI